MMMISLFVVDGIVGSSHRNIQRVQNDNRRLMRKQAPMLPFVSLLQILLVVVATTAVVGQQTSSPFHIRINSGGPLIVDRTNNDTLWLSDTPYNVGNKGKRHIQCVGSSTTIIQNIPVNVPRELYCSQRYFNPTQFPPPYQYNIPVPTNHSYYIVMLHFVEFTHTTTNQRVMDFFIEDQLVLDDFDIVAVTGGSFRAYSVTINQGIYINDGAVTITMNATTGIPILAGIEVIASANIVTHRINCGSSSNTPVIMNNVSWIKDTTYALSGALSNRCARTNTTNSIYCTSRYFRTSIGTPLRYNIPVPFNNSLYMLRLHFNEQFHNVIGARVFDVLVENTIILDNFDIIRSAPGKNVPMIVSPTTMFSVTDSTITIDFVEIIADPHIHGIEVIYIGPMTPISPLTAPSAPTLNPIVVPVKAPMVLSPVEPPVLTGNMVHRINCGSTNQVVVPPINVVWTPDQYATTGLSYNTCGNITTSIYCTSRYFRTNDPVPHRYNLPVPASNRTYQVRLHFAEQFFSRVGARTFDIYVEGILVNDNLDMYAIASGRNVPYTTTVFSFVIDGSITIDLVRVKENPQINGIEVFDDGAPLPAPTTSPQVNPPTIAPLPLPPNSAPVSANATFQDIVINCGGSLYLEQSGLRYWSADNSFNGGSTYSITNIEVANTVDDPIYQSERLGVFSYSIPVPVGTYEINIHLSELALTRANLRLFNLTIESQAFDLVDIFALAGGAARAVSLGTTVVVDDGFATISVVKVVNDPKINGIEILKSIPHYAHSVSNGPYFAVDKSNVGFATVNVDGSESHTHGIDLVLNSWIWKKGAQTLGTGAMSSFNLSVGTHDITFTVVDDGNFEATEATTVTVHRFGFPDITALNPSSGSIIGGEQVTIQGTGFNHSAANTIVYFGTEQLTGSAIQIVNFTTIIVHSPTIPISVPVLVSIQTPIGRSQVATYTYVSSTPILFLATKLQDFIQPTSAEFGPDGKLYVGSYNGTLARITLNENFTSVVSFVEAVVQPNRAILGIAFDPLDAGNPLPGVYISSSLLLHGGNTSSSGLAINGKISRISGSNLDIIEDIITGLPVCNNDHAVNQIQFGNEGELYINLGSNTNGGHPGRLSSGVNQKENYFSASTIVANLAHPSFDGFIEYDAIDDGSPINFSGISIFAAGLRNPYGVTIHSNGYLYATDNGPNNNYGKMKIGCSPSDLLADQQREDKLVRLVKDKYYGHPNPKRATYHNDPRQCVWRNPTEPTSLNYEAPIGIILSAAAGIIEYQADHFNGQLRGNLIHVKYQFGLLRTVISVDGLTANPLTIPGIQIAGQNGLDVAQAPNGNLVEARYQRNGIWINSPIEAVTAAIRVSSVFPTRGSVAGGTTLRIYGLNFGTTMSEITVTVGGSSCPIVGVVLATYIQCTLPGKPEGLYDIVVTAVTGTYTFQKGYRYIKGFP